MSEAHLCDTKLDNPLQFRFSKITKKQTQKMRRTLNKYMTTLNYADRTLLVLPGAVGCVSLWPFITIIRAAFGIAAASISVVLLISNEKLFLKRMGRKKQLQK